jgi:hypothetical protein
MQKSHVCSIRKELINRKIKEDTGFAAMILSTPCRCFWFDRLRSNIQLLGYGKYVRAADRRMNDSKLTLSSWKPVVCGVSGFRGFFENLNDRI